MDFIKKYKMPIIIGAIVLVVIIIFIKLRNKSKGAYGIVVEKGDGDVLPDTKPTTPVSTKPVFPLKKGSGYENEGRSNAKSYVIKLQEWLNMNLVKKGLVSKTLKIDGYFGDKTESALKEITGNIIFSKEQYDAIINTTVN